MKMKTIDLFCASPASTAICSSMDQRAMVRHGSRPVHRHHYHQFGDQKPRIRTPIIPCSSQQPINPKPYNYTNYQKSRKSTASTSAKQIISESIRRKSSADTSDQNIDPSPLGSSRYLLSDIPFNGEQDLYSGSDYDPDHVSALVVSEPVRSGGLISANNNVGDSLALKKSLSMQSRSSTYDSPVFMKSSSACCRTAESPAVLKSSRSRPRHQVVELMVSIHCKGCEGKVRKHLSRMEGVTSYSIDLATKKVTVIGDVNPLSVLSSISRVKNAQFWPSPTSPSSSSSPLLVIRY